MPAASGVLDDVVAVLDAAREVGERLDALGAAPLQEARRDVAAQLGRLVYPGFVAAAGARRLPDVRRYLLAAARRLERAGASPAVDRDRMRAIQALEAEHRAAVAAAGRPVPEALREIGWMLEELRVSQFAQALGVREGVSAKKVRRALAQAAPAAAGRA